jgi:hypothetical protein
VEGLVDEVDLLVVEGLVWVPPAEDLFAAFPVPVEGWVAALSADCQLLP